MPYKIIVDGDACIGCGACAAICENFRIVDGKSHAIKEIVAEPGCNKEAADSCPVSAIKIEKK